MRVKIVSNGTTAGTHVINAETGEEIDGVMSVAWEARADHPDGVALCRIDVLARLEVEAEAEIERVHPIPWFPKEAAHASAGG